MQVNLKKLTLSNFKGIESYSLELGKSTHIAGDNATGKTTLFDAYLWLLFGKDSQDRKDADILPINKKGEPDLHVDATVEGHFEIDGNPIVLKRSLHPHWATRRGSAEEEYKGNQTKLWINDVPKKSSEFQEKVSEFVDDTIFKLLSNPMHFTGMHWKLQQEIIFSMVPEITFDDVIDKNPLYAKIAEKYKGKHPIKDIMPELKALRNKLQEELDQLPSRIDEAKLSMPEEVDVITIKDLIDSKKILIESIENKMEAISEAHRNVIHIAKEKGKKAASIQEQVSAYKYKVDSEHDIAISKHNKDLANAQRYLGDIDAKIDNAKTALKNAEFKVFRLVEENNELRAEWSEINSKEFKATIDDTCGSCGQKLPEGDVNELKAKAFEAYNNAKNKKLTQISDLGDTNKKEIQVLEEKVSILKKEVDHLDTEHEKCVKKIDSLKKKIEKHGKPKYDKAILKELQDAADKAKAEYESYLNKSTGSEDMQPHKDEIRSIEEEISVLKSKLSVNEHRQKIESRIQSLMETHKKSGTIKAMAEQEIIVIQSWERDLVEEMEKMISEKFKIVKFRMYKEQINGGFTPTCEAMVDGVPFGSVNNASRINAGLDIIKALEEYYDTKVPVFIDNSESITRPITAGSQMVHLIVSESHKKLTVL